MVLVQHIGDYSQTIRLGNVENHVEIKRNGETLFDGVAKHINDQGSFISFKDENDELHEYQKYTVVTTI